MAEQLPLRKYIKVWIKRRQNNARKDGSKATSYTLEWVEYGKRSFMSLGIGATAGYARHARAIKEQELNSLAEFSGLSPITWPDLEAKYLTNAYPDGTGNCSTVNFRVRPAKSTNSSVLGKSDGCGDPLLFDMQTFPLIRHGELLPQPLHHR